MTRRKMLILDIVRRAGHITAENVFRAARSEMPSISMGTVYRNLNALVDEGQLYRINVRNQPDVYDKTPTVHAHRVCDCCGDFSDAFLSGEVLSALSDAADGRLSSFDLVLHYICNGCKGTDPDIRPA